MNVTGNISHIISFRVTPDIARETGTGSSLNGSYTFRLKYAYAQLNLDDWMTRRLVGALRHAADAVGRLLETRLPLPFPGHDLQGSRRLPVVVRRRRGVPLQLPRQLRRRPRRRSINGENYNRAEANDQKAFMVRGTVRPLPMHPVLRGLRLTGFYNHDAYVKNAERRRGHLRRPPSSIPT